MSTLLIIGAGGHGRVLADAALAMNRWQSIAFADDRIDATNILGLQVVGGSADLERLARSYQDVVIGIGNASTRLQLLHRCRQIGFQIARIVHPSAIVSSFASIGEGTVVFAQAAVNAGATLGRACIINTGATVDHDCELADGVHACPGVHVAGGVKVGLRAWLGIGSCVKQGINIGSDVTVGAGAVVVCDIEAGLTVVGAPARARQGET